MNSVHILLVTVAVFLVKNTGEAAGSNYKRVCYYTNWSQYRKGDGNFTPQNIEPNLCTHIIFAFAKLSGNSLATIEPNDKQLYKQLTALKAQNPSLKVTLAVGGWNAGSAVFSRMAATQASRASFIQNTIRFLRDNGLDGLDIDWEYPANRGGAAADKQNIGLLVKEMRAAFTQESSSSGKDRLLISVAVPAGKSAIDSGYDVRTVAQNVDFINLMSYDLHGPWEGKAGENGPLYSKQSETGAAATQNTAWAANYWNKMGAPKEKIIVGISFFGKSYNLASSASHDVGARITGSAPAGPFTGEAGVLSYYENCKMQELGGTDYWESEQRVPYYVNGNLWVGYDNVRSIQEKADFVKKEGFGGLMVWSIDGDDFKNICSSSKTTYPLLKAINKALSGGSAPVTNAPTTPTTTTTTTTTQRPTTARPTTARPTAGMQTTAKPMTDKPDGPVTSMPITNGPTDAPTNAPPNPVPTTVAVPKPTTHLSNILKSTAIPSSQTSFTCDARSDGYFTDPNSCQVFHRCLGGKDFHFSCTTGTQYNPKLHECDWPQHVGCIEGRR